jgi:hypothetical protein
MEFENVANKPELISGSGIPTYIPLFDSQTFLTSSIIQQINGELIIDGDVVISGSFTGNVIPRVTTVISTSTITPNIDTTDQFNVTALAEGTTLSEPTGTPTDGQKLIVRIKDNGTARTIGYNVIYRAFGVALPTTTTISKTLYLGSIYNSTDTRWDVITVAEEM